MKYAFFPGCSLESTAWDFCQSTRAVFDALGIELEEIPGWVCCGSTPAHASNASLSIALPVFNLQRARELKSPVLAACASCYARLRTANYQVLNDPKQREKAERITGEPYDGSIKVHHVLDALVYQLGLPSIRAAVRRPLAGLRVACYYGCLLTRPPEVVAFEDAEHPTSMEKLVAALGGEPVEWPYKTECCGASLSMTNSNVVGRLSHRLVDMAAKAGAECIAVACPLCQVNLDLRQADARRSHGDLPATPALYITQLLGLALGLSPKQLGLQALSVSFDGLLSNLSSPSGRGAGGEGCGSPICSCPHPNPLPKGEGTVGVAGGNR